MTYTNLQQARLEAMLRAAVSNSSYLPDAHSDLTAAFNGDENAALAAFGDVLLAHKQDCQRLADATERVSLFSEYGAQEPQHGVSGINGADGDIGRGGAIETAQNAAVTPLKEMRQTPITSSWFSDDDDDSDDDWTPSRCGDNDVSRPPFRWR